MKQCIRALTSANSAQPVKHYDGLFAQQQHTVMIELAKLLAGDFIRPVSVRDYSNQFLHRTQTELKRRTFVNRRRGIELFLKYFQQRCNMPLHAVKKPDICDFRDHLLAIGAHQGTVKQRIGVLHTMFSAAIEEGYIRHNPCHGVM